MGTISKKIADDVIAGLYNDDRPTRIVEYTNKWGSIAYGLTVQGEDINRYMHETEYIIKPKIYWEKNPAK